MELSRKNSDPSMLVGVGLDNRDGHKRVTEGDNFCLVGGSEETHDRMTETAIKFNEKLARKGKNLSELSPEEFRDMMHEASGKWKTAENNVIKDFLINYAKMEINKNRFLEMEMINDRDIIVFMLKQA